MKSFWLFLAGIAVLFAPIPLAAWAARGRWRDAWEATKGYGKVMGLMLLAAVVLGVLMVVASVAS